MRLKYIDHVKRILLTVAMISSFAFGIQAQEGEARVIDEVIAQVNNDVVTLSMVKRETKDAIASLVQQGKAQETATAEISGRQNELIASLINEQLLLQQGKELGLTEEVEAEVNKRMLEVARNQGIKTIEELKKAMKESGFDYDAVRQTMRAELMKQAVLSRDVDGRIFWGLSMDELKKYYETHKDKFKKPETVTLSEIFISLAGKSEADVKARVDQLIAQARGGADFATLAKANSERLQDGKLVAAETGGKVGTFQLTDLRDNIAAAVKNLKSGGVSDPIRYDEGFQIIRVDDRIAGSDVPTFNESHARELITGERSEAARKAYMEKLRKDAYIKVSDPYRADVLPLIGMSAKADASKASSTSTPATSAQKKSDKNGNKPKR